MSFPYDRREPLERNLEESFAFSGKVVNASMIVSTTKFSKLTSFFTNFASSSIRGISWAPSGLYITYTSLGVPNVATTSSIATFFYNGETATKISSPTVLPGAWPSKSVNTGADAYSAAWSPDGTKLAVGSKGTHKVNVYSFTTSQTFNHIAQADLPFTFVSGSYAYDLSWSPDSQLLCATFDSEPYCYIFKVTDTSVQPFYNLGAFHPFFTTGTDWSPDGRYLALTYTRPPYLALFEFDGENFTELSIPSTMPVYSRMVKWSPDGNYLLVCHIQAPGISLWSFDNNKLKRLTVSPNRPVVTGQSDRCIWVDWAPDGQSFLTSWTYSPIVNIYSFDGSSAVRIPAPPNFAPAPSTAPTPRVLYRPGGDAFVFSEYLSLGANEYSSSSNMLELSRVNNTPT